MIADLTRMGEWSPENTGGRWLGGARGPSYGARFRGTNRHGRRRWSTLAVVTSCDRGRTFAFDISALGLNVSRWSYDFEKTPSGCRVTETYTDLRSPLVAFLGKPISGVADRAAHNRATMEVTLDNLAKAAESAAPAG